MKWRDASAILFILVVFGLIALWVNFPTGITEDEEIALVKAEELIKNRASIIEFSFYTRKGDKCIAKHVFENFAGGLNHVYLESQARAPELRKIRNRIAKIFNQLGIDVIKRENGIILSESKVELTPDHLHVIFEKYAQLFNNLEIVNPR